MKSTHRGTVRLMTCALVAACSLMLNHSAFAGDNETEKSNNRRGRHAARANFDVPQGVSDAVKQHCNDKGLPNPTQMEYTGERQGNGRVVRVHFGNEHIYLVATPNGQGGYDITPFGG